MPFSQDRFALLLNSTNDNSNALDLLIRIIKRESDLVDSKSQTAEQALSLILLMAKREQLLKDNIRSSVTLQVENDKFVRTYHRNKALAERIRLKRSRNPRRVYRQYTPELDISTLTSLPLAAIQSHSQSQSQYQQTPLQRAQTMHHLLSESDEPQDESFTTPAENQPEDVSSYLDAYFTAHPEDKLDSEE